MSLSLLVSCMIIPLSYLILFNIHLFIESVFKHGLKICQLKSLNLTWKRYFAGY